MSTRQPTTVLDRYASRTARVALRPVRAIAFWSAVALPFAVLALTLTGTTDPLTLVPLFAANVLALVAGRDHTPN
ncbi:hypothetical protein [Halocalculus aciditolerans]|uniref:Uncharacterized protein n=1 Tax=Halocalculus aciditolerans TaxID=1383812 RepID=A0A830FNA1_9EURY|nr:hypothetical protein [Halocalculus aciditolerans]GGL63919.1 hypothetical protein GCM10009039_22230 [Halocalculus aciditolerans]